MQCRRFRHYISKFDIHFLFLRSCLRPWSQICHKDCTRFRFLLCAPHHFPFQRRSNFKPLHIQLLHMCHCHLCSFRPLQGTVYFPSSSSYCRRTRGRFVSGIVFNHYHLLLTTMKNFYGPRRIRVWPHKRSGSAQIPKQIGHRLDSRSFRRFKGMSCTLLLKFLMQ